MNISTNNLIEITDIKGSKIFELNFCGKQIAIDIENYPKGTYFVKVLTSESCVVEKIIKY